jgi:glutamyl-tRNA synthetase
LEKDGVINPEKRPDGEWFKRLVTLLTERSHTLVEMKQAALPFLLDDIVLDEKARTKHLTADTAPLLGELVKRLQPLDAFTHDAIESVFNALVAEKGIKLGKLAQPVRVAVTGGTVSPGIFEVLQVLGKEKTLKRIQAAVSKIP